MNSIKINENNVREFHIWNLPFFVRVSFNENVRNELFKEIFKSIGTLKELTKLIKKETNQKIDHETIRDYKNGKYFIPLWFLNNIMELFFDKEFYAQLEKEIIAFRGPRGDSINNPKFPWIEDERIIRIIFRLIGDGHGGGDVSKGRVPVYTNSCSELVEQFVDDLNFFGQVKVRKYRKNNIKRNTDVEFPKVLGHIAKHLYNMDFRGKHARLSNEIFSLPENLVIEGIKVFGDDEGSMKGTQIHFYSANKGLLQDFITLFNIKFSDFKSITNVRINVIKKDKNSNIIITYYIAIRANDLDKYCQLIGFYHPLKQQKLIHQLNCRDKIKNNRWNYKTKEMILKSLFNNSKTSYQISEDVLVNHRTVNKHINGYSNREKNFKGLKELGLVKPIYSQEGILWEITEKGKTYKFCLNSLK